MHTPLDRRAFLGIRLDAGEGAFSGAGMRVAGVVPGSMGAEADLLPGDVVVQLGDHVLVSDAALARAVRAAGRELEIEVRLERAGARLVRRVAVRHWPNETIEGHDVSYTSVRAGDARLRTIETCPTDGGHARHPAVLLVQGVGTGSIDFGATPNEPLCRLVHGFARAGLVTMRVDKRGAGDSEGEVDADFEQELEGWRAGLDALALRPSVDPDRIFLFGHSVGGMAAPLLARGGSAHVRGVIVHGTSAMSWRACLERSARRQLELHGVARDQIEQRLACRDYLSVRSERYHEQLDGADVAAAWRGLACDVLVLHGEHDWVADRDDARGVCALLPAGRSELVGLRGVDHWLTRHETREQSLRAPGAGAHDEQALDASVSWIRARLER